MSTEWRKAYINSLPPVNNPISKSLEEIIENHEADGWQFVALMPGQDHGVAEHRVAPQALFRREKP